MALGINARRDSFVAFIFIVFSKTKNRDLKSRNRLLQTNQRTINKKKGEQKAELQVSYMGMASNALSKIPSHAKIIYDLNQDFDRSFASDAIFENLCMNQVPSSRTMSSPKRGRCGWACRHMPKRLDS